MIQEARVREKRADGVEREAGRAQSASPFRSLAVEEAIFVVVAYFKNTGLHFFFKKKGQSMGVRLPAPGPPRLLVRGQSQLYADALLRAGALEGSIVE